MRPLFHTLTLLLLFTASACNSAQPRRADNSPAQQLGKIYIYYEYTSADAAAPPTAFHVNRADSPKGPFSRVNPRPIAAQDGAKPGDRQLLLSDEALPMARAYYYYIEKVDPRGSATKATSVARATVTLPLLPATTTRAQAPPAPPEARAR
jgi:hypothetical protein